MYAKDIASPKRQTETPFLFQVLVLSAVLHLIIGYLLIQSHSAPSKVESKKLQIKPIQAKLIFAPAQPQQPKPPQEIELDVSPEPELEAKEISEPIVENSQEIENSEATMPKFTELEIDTRRADLPQISSPSLSASDNGIAPRDLAKHHLKDFTQNANNALAKQEAERFRQQQKSPNIVLPKSDGFLTEDEKFIKQQSVHVDCSSGLNKSLVVVASFTGGNLDCSKSQSIAPFIDKHLNKGLGTKEN